MIIVATNVASELMRPSPSSSSGTGCRVGLEGICIHLRLRSQRSGTASRSCLKGDGTTRLVLRQMRYSRLLLAQQILTFDAVAAEQYALIVSHRDGLGLPIDGFDVQIAAICDVHGATLATRNVSDSVRPASS